MSVVQGPPIQTPGSLRSLMDALCMVQHALGSRPEVDGLDPLDYHRWKPGQSDSPMLYNVLLPSPPPQQMDTARIRDNFVIATRIGGFYTDADTDWATLEVYVDAYRALVDPNYWNGFTIVPPMGGKVTWAYRSSMQTFADSIGGSQVGGIEFTQTLAVDRLNR